MKAWSKCKSSSDVSYLVFGWLKAFDTNLETGGNTIRGDIVLKEGGFIEREAH